MIPVVVPRGEQAGGDEPLVQVKPLALQPSTYSAQGLVRITTVFSPAVRYSWASTRVHLD